MYLGEASVAHSRVDKFLRIAKFLGVSQLSDQCKADIVELNKEFSVEITIVCQHCIVACKIIVLDITASRSLRALPHMIN